MANNESATFPFGRIVIMGRICFALGIMGIGIQHFIFSAFIPVMVPWWPAANPNHIVWAYFLGLILISGGLLIILSKIPVIVTSLLGILFFLSVIILHIPQNIIANFISPGAWTNTLKELAFCGSAFIVGGTFLQTNRATASFMDMFAKKIVPYAKFPMAIMLIVFGLDHFLYVNFVATLVPGWIPGHTFWTYFAGIALMAGGLGLILNIKARLASNCVGIMIFTWLLILHIPRAVTDPSGGLGNEWTSVFEALSYSGVYFILGQTLPKRERSK